MNPRTRNASAWSAPTSVRASQKPKVSASHMAFFLAAAGVLVPFSVSAFPVFTEASTYTLVGNFNLREGDQGYQHNNANMTSTASAASSLAGPDPTGSASASARANARTDIGGIRLFANASSMATQAVPAFGGVVAFARGGEAQGRWGDSFTIDGGALNGQMGRLTAGFSVNGTFGASWDASTALVAHVDQYFRTFLRLTNGAGSGQDIFVRGGQRRTIDFQGEVLSDAHGEPFRAPGIWTVEIDFIFGTPIQVYAWGEIQSDVNAYAHVSSGYPSSVMQATVDFGHTMAWDGIGSITDISGNVLPSTGYTLSSASGFDYRNAFPPVTTPIPEPKPLTLMSLGLASIALARRFRLFAASGA